MRIGIRTVVFMALAAAVGLWAADDPLMGTWKLNVEKSNFGSGQAPKSQIVKMEPEGANGLKFMEEIVDAKGEMHQRGYSAMFDGKDHPVEVDANRDAVMFKRIDAHKMEIINKKAGKVTYTILREVSPDGKSVTVTFKGANAQTQAMNRTMVFDKQ